MDVEAKRKDGVKRRRGERKEGGHKEDCIHKSFSLGIVVRYQGIEEEKRDRCWLRAKKIGTGGSEGVRGNSEYAGLNSITCKHGGR